MTAKTFEKWCADYDVNYMGGIGSGCSYNRLYEWCKPAWDYRQAEIDQLESRLATGVEALDTKERLNEGYRDQIAELKDGIRALLPHAKRSLCMDCESAAIKGCTCEFRILFEKMEKYK